MATKVTTDHGSPEDEVAIPPECQDSVSDSSVSLTAGKENTLNIRKRDSKYVLDREGHHRYLRLGRALLYLKEGLHEPVLSEVNKLHSKLKEKIKEKESVFDKKKFLNSYLQSNYLNKNVKNNKIYINNVNIEKWEDQPWETAKAFMQSGQTEGNILPKDTDSMGILRLISSCKQFDDWLEREVPVVGMSGDEKVLEVLTIRHSVGHSSSWCCTETEMEEGIEKIIILMEHMKQRFKSLADDKNVSEDDKIIYQEAEKKMVDALRSVEKVKTDIDFDVMSRLVVEDICKSRAYESANETQRQELVKIQSRYATRKIFIVLNDLFKKHSKAFKEYLLQREILESFIIDANTDVMFLLAALEEKQMFQAEELFELLRLIEPSLDYDRLQPIKTTMDICKRTLKRTSDIETGIVYDVFILHCEADTEKSDRFRKSHLDILKDLNPPAKTILYDEYVVPGTTRVSALDYVFKDCRLVFILLTPAFMKDNLSMFQAEMFMYDSLQKTKNSRVIPVYLKEKDCKSSPIWLKVVTPIDVWRQNSDRLMRTLQNAREKFLNSRQ